MRRVYNPFNSAGALLAPLLMALAYAQTNQGTGIGIAFVAGCLAVLLSGRSPGNSGPGGAIPGGPIRALP